MVKCRCGIVLIELLVAMVIFSMASVALTSTFVYEQKLLLQQYYRAIAMEIVDGEMELLVAGEWQSYIEGRHIYHTTAKAFSNLPPGQLMLTIVNKKITLEWLTDSGTLGPYVIREAEIR